MDKRLIVLCLCCLASQAIATNNTYIFRNATLTVYMHNRLLQDYPDYTHGYSIDSVRLIDETHNPYKVLADYGEQEIFLYQYDRVRLYFKNLRHVRCYTTMPYDNYYIYGGDRYATSGPDSVIVICFKMSCRLLKIVPNINSTIDEDAYQNPREILQKFAAETEAEGEELHYCHYWDNYEDRRTFWSGEYYLIDSVLSYRSLDSLEIKDLRLKKIDNSEPINKYGVW